MLNKRTGPTKREGWTIFENLINGQGRYVPEKLKYSYTSSFLSNSDAKSNFLYTYFYLCFGVNGMASTLRCLISGQALISGQGGQFLKIL